MKANKQIIGLDLIRFAAALIVMAHHLCFWMWSGAAFGYRGGGYDTSYHQLASYAWFGWIGVEIFFVLSGFVIAYSAEHSNALDFARSRLLRLYPAAWICASITLVARILTNSTSNDPLSHAAFFERWAKSVTLWPSGAWIDGSYWTLGVELGFYLLVFLLLTRGLFRMLGPTITVVGAVSSILAFWEWTGRFHETHVTRSLRLHAPVDWRFRSLLLQHGMFFAIGVLLWLMLFHRATLARACGLVICSVGALFEILNHTAEVARDTGFAFSPLVPLLLWAAAVGAIVLSVRRNAALAAALGPRGMAAARKLGLMTYPLYLLHQIVGYALIHLGQGRIPDLASLALVTMALLGASYVIALYGEKPLQRGLRTLLHAPRKAEPTPAATAP